MPRRLSARLSTPAARISNRSIPPDRDPVHLAERGVALIERATPVVDRVVHCAAVVPEADVAHGPPVSACELWLNGVAEEERQEGVAFGLAQSFDTGRERLVHEECLPAGLRVSTNHGMRGERFLPLLVQDELVGLEGIAHGIAEEV